MRPASRARHSSSSACRSPRSMACRARSWSGSSHFTRRGSRCVCSSGQSRTPWLPLSVTPVTASRRPFLRQRAGGGVMASPSIGRHSRRDGTLTCAASGRRSKPRYSLPLVIHAHHTAAAPMSGGLTPSEDGPMPQNVFHRTGSGAVPPTRQSVALREWAEQRRIAYRTVPGRAAVR